MPEKNEDALTIGGKEISIKLAWIPQVDLKFYPENPRIYSIVCADEKEPNQEEIEERLTEMDRIRVLAQSIRANGGLLEPLIVKANDNIVLEGNSRLAAYRILAKENPVKWGKVKCKLLPTTISDDDIFALLGEYHIISRKDWEPYEQAGYLYRRHKMQKVTIENIGKELGIKPSEIKHLIEVYEFMIKHKDNDSKRWSYYHEYLSSNSIQKARDRHPELDKVIVEKIKTKEIPRADDIRSKLKTITKAPSPKILDKLTKGEIKFDEAYERATAGGAGNVIYERFHRFRTQLAENKLEEDIAELDEALTNKCIFELKKIHTRAEQLIKRFK